MRRLLPSTWLIVIKLFCRDLYSVYVTMFVEGYKLDDSSVNYLIKETALVLSVMPKISTGRVEHLILCSLVNFVKPWQEKTVLISQKSCVSSLVMPITNLIGTYIGVLYNPFAQKVNQWKSKLAFVFFSQI